MNRSASGVTTKGEEEKKVQRVKRNKRWRELRIEDDEKTAEVKM